MESLKLLTYPLIHYSFMHALFSVLYILTVGKMLCNMVRDVAVVLTFFVCSAVAGVLSSLVTDFRFPLAGASPGYFGMLGLLAGTLLVVNGKRAIDVSPGLFLFPFIMISANLVFDILSAGLDFWIANLIGFITGFSVSFVVFAGAFPFMVIGFRRLLRR